MGLPLDQSTSCEKSAAVFARLAHELAGLALIGDTLQDVLGRAIADGDAQASITGDTLQSLQSLDLLTQTLDALRMFVSNLAEDPATEGSVNIEAALKRIPLAGLASRLAGRTEEQPSDMEFDLF